MHEFLRGLSAETGTDFTQYAPVFAGLGMRDRAHFEVLVRREGLMRKNEQRLEAQGVSPWAIDVMQDALKDRFAVP